MRHIGPIPGQQVLYVEHRHGALGRHVHVRRPSTVAGLPQNLAFGALASALARLTGNQNAAAIGNVLLSQYIAELAVRSAWRRGAGCGATR